MVSSKNGSSRIDVQSILTAVSSEPVSISSGGNKSLQVLSALDHAMGLHSLHLVFYFAKRPFLGTFDLDPLRESLSEVLSLYPRVTGRLTRGETGNWEVKFNDAGVRVVKAKVGVALDEWLRSAHGSEEKDLVVWEEMPPEDPYTWSPFRIQVTEFEGGGLAIGLSCTHIQADPTTLILLFNSWVETYRKEPIEHPPLFIPSAFHDRKPSIPRTESSDHHYAAKASAEEAPMVKMQTATFKFSNSTIKQCLSEVHDKCPEATPFDLLVALFWTRISRLKASKHDQKHTLSVCLDFRNLVQPPIPLGYFGNAVHFSPLSLDEDEMNCGELGRVVSVVHGHVAGVREEEVLSGIDWLESQKQEEGKYAAAFTMYGPELTCVSMEHMIVGDRSLMYGKSFDRNEKPVHVAFHLGNVEGEGLIIVMPSSEKGLARTVMVTLPEEETAKLREDQAILRLEPVMLISGGEQSILKLRQSEDAAIHAAHVAANS